MKLILNARQVGRALVARLRVAWQTVKLIPNARQVLLRSYSQQMQMAALAGIGAYSALPEKLQDVLPVWAVLGLAAALLVLGIVGRLIEQPKLHAEAPDGQP